ncbi:hypothetical protein L1987_33985 [Smallanthus sonchifolius]|uniref:Uncharacterized protein n=1 Tax=Smallanthus sonchifolius TaxID=185202 RepID=A0ACB9HSZ2_9ASTR|nr:hypothetical protein L1987_33985 [Smallanthus sonchifolius]
MASASSHCQEPATSQQSAIIFILKIPSNMTFAGAVTAITTTIVSRTIDATSTTVRPSSFRARRLIFADQTLRLGLPFVPSYLCQSDSVKDMTHGSNYSSAGAGIIFSSGSELASIYHSVSKFNKLWIRFNSSY